MSSFSDNNFGKKLSELNNTQQSIQTLSLWLIHHRKHSKSIVQVWFRELQRVKPSKKLHFIYLANDVIQNSKKKGPEFSRDFGTVLPDAYKLTAKDADGKIKQTLERILNIWGERGVYDKDFIEVMRLSLNSPSAKWSDVQLSTTTVTTTTANTTSNTTSSSSSASTTTSTTTTTTTTNSSSSNKSPTVKRKRHQEHQLTLKQELDAMEEIGKPPTTEELVKTLYNVENSPSSDAAVRERIAALPQEVADQSCLDKLKDKEDGQKLSETVDEAYNLLTDYNQRLAQELIDRKENARMIHTYLNLQRELLQLAESRLVEYKLKLEKVTTVREELESHIQNLPDLTLLQDVTPLPSAGDLFSI
ncbi:regulation of nuclear pre-mRNA domain-containing protein 1B-like [Argonauta hians]